MIRFQVRVRVELKSTLTFAVMLLHVLNQRTVALITRKRDTLETLMNLKHVEKCRVGSSKSRNLSHDVQVASRPQI